MAVFKKAEVRNAVFLGTLCSLSYLAVYFARNTLGVVSPQAIDEGTFTTEAIGAMSSLYFITYAVGQLINGTIGDRIHAKYMIGLGLICSGITSMIVPLFAHTFWVSYLAYGMTGFFLSMIYGPMTKVVSENTNLVYATRCSLGYTLASFLGSPMAGLFAMLMSWQGVFYSNTAALLLMGVVCFAVFTRFEHTGVVRYNQFRDKTEKRTFNVKLLLERQIVKFTIVALLTGVIRTAVVNWMTIYFTQFLGYPPDQAAFLFTVCTLPIAASAFIAIFIFERLRRNIDLSLLLFFSSAAVFFLLVFFVRQPIWNIVFLLLAIISSNSAATMLYSRYCPSLRDTGMVSTATGFLDFSSYVSASVFTQFFPTIIKVAKYDALILIWVALMCVGIAISLPWKRRAAPLTRARE